MAKKKIEVFTRGSHPKVLGRNFLAVVVTNCNGCWRLVDDRLEICPYCGANSFTGKKTSCETGKNPVRNTLRDRPIGKTPGFDPGNAGSSPPPGILAITG